MDPAKLEVRRTASFGDVRIGVAVGDGRLWIYRNSSWRHAQTGRHNCLGGCPQMLIPSGQPDLFRVVHSSAGSSVAKAVQCVLKIRCWAVSGLVYPDLLSRRLNRRCGSACRNELLTISVEGLSAAARLTDKTNHCETKSKTSTQA